MGHRGGCPEKHEWGFGLWEWWGAGGGAVSQKKRMGVHRCESAGEEEETDVIDASQSELCYWNKKKGYTQSSVNSDLRQAMSFQKPVSRKWE